MKTKKLDNFVRRHFAERKVFYNRTLNKNFGGAQFHGSQRTKSMLSQIFLSLTYHPASGRLMRKLLRRISYDVKQHALNFSAHKFFHICNRKKVICKKAEIL